MPALIALYLQDDYLFLYRAMESLVATMSLNESDSSPYGSQLTVTANHINSNGHAVKLVIPGDLLKTSESFA